MFTIFMQNLIVLSMSCEQRYSCKKCGRLIKKDDSICKHCGSNQKMIYLKITDSVGVNDGGRLKQKRPGFSGFMIYAKFGSNLFRKTNTWTHLTRIIDRLNNVYEERITDPKTGKTRCVKEKLTEHIGHGSAKRKL